jgi:hypothetical protein
MSGDEIQTAHQIISLVAEQRQTELTSEMAGSELTSSIDEEYLEAHLVFFERSKELFGDAGLDPESGLFDDSMLEGFAEHTRVLLRRGSYKLAAQSTDRLLETWLQW